MSIVATWNLNHRIGRTRFRAEAVNVIAALRADVVVLTEYYPGDHESVFRADLSNAGWPYLLASENVGEIANRILIASRLLLEPFPLPLPDFDRHWRPNSGLRKKRYASNSAFVGLAGIHLVRIA